jgi:heptosyltransferase-2
VISSNSPKRLLVVGPSWVGDMMMAQSLFMLLKSRTPSCHIDVLAPDWSKPLLDRMPEVTAAISAPFQHGQLGLSARYRLGKSLRGKEYNEAILLPNSFKSALVPFWARIPKRTGYVGEFRYGLLNDARKLDKQALPMTVQRFAALGLDAGQPLPDRLPEPHLETEANSVTESLNAVGLATPGSPVLALCPGAEFGPAKRWPSRHYAAVARRYLESGWHVWLFGSDKDQPVCNEINTLCENRCEDLSGRTRLGQAIDLMSLASAAVSNDSGLMHIAAALGLPMVAVYGSSDPGFTPPLSKQARISSLKLECSPCFKRECPLGHLDCLNKLERYNQLSPGARFTPGCIAYRNQWRTRSTQGLQPQRQRLQTTNWTAAGVSGSSLA